MIRAKIDRSASRRANLSFDDWKHAEGLAVTYNLIRRSIGELESEYGSNHDEWPKRIRAKYDVLDEGLESIFDQLNEMGIRMTRQADGLMGIADIPDDYRRWKTTRPMKKVNVRLSSIR